MAARCNATIELTRWQERCGVHASIVMRIFKYAACCGAVVKLPADPCLNAVASCFEFPQTQRCPALRPSPLKLDLMAFFYVKIPEKCYEGGDADAATRLIEAHRRYTEFVKAPTDCRDSDEDTVYAHVRSGDIFRRHHHSWWAYQQPPISFITNAWAHSKKTNLVVVAEDRLNPVVEALERMPNVTSTVSKDESAHGALLRCAASLILTNSNYGMMAFRANRRVKDLYVWNWKHDAVYSELSRHQLVNGRCDTRVHVVSTPKEQMRKRTKWDGSSNTTRELLLHEVTRYERTILLPCVPSRRPVVRAAALR